MPAVAAILISLFRCQVRFPAFQGGVFIFMILGANKKNLLRSLICCYMDITWTSKPKVAGSIPTVVRLIFQLAWCGIYTQSNNTIHITRTFFCSLEPFD